MNITFFPLWKLNAITSIKPIQSTERMDRTDRRVTGGEGDAAVEGTIAHLGPRWLSPCKTGPDSLLGQKQEPISSWSQFYFVCEFVILVNYISFLGFVSNSKRQKNDFRGAVINDTLLSLSNQHLKSKGSFQPFHL